MDLAEMGRNIRSSFHHHASSFQTSLDAKSYGEHENEVKLHKEENGKSVVDVTKLGDLERHVFIENLLKKIEDNNHRLLEKLRGRIDREVGYTQGYLHNPSYNDVCSGTTNHSEVVRVQYDPKECSYESLLDVFWARHDPTSLNRQVDEWVENHDILLF
ncbi:hypothetical protein LOK49_LG15G00035 [Camellia lanceoleosa]|uniref:Uncharacterized protein n=1 Tax=Camellia lanceoleosa TaxID=1840588 RepID=A0ACC0F5E1_9ERIC|nr:hypothetical protein LOK49_LG15G00035 [Camellia lanceoleosa]